MQGMYKHQLYTHTPYKECLSLQPLQKGARGQRFYASSTQTGDVGCTQILSSQVSGAFCLGTSRGCCEGSSHEASHIQEEQ